MTSQPFITLLFLPGLIGLVSSFTATWIVIKLAPRLGIVDDPQAHQHPKTTHTYPVPRGGGLPIFLALIVGTILFLPFDKHLLGILSGAATALIVGLLDDRWNLSPYWRLFGGNLLAALIVVGSGIGVAFLTNPFGSGIIDLSHPQFSFYLFGAPHSLWLLADLFAVLWIVGLMNLIGQGAGGIEGQFPGVVAISALTIGLLSLKFSADITQWPVITLAGITAGAYLGFLPWNFPPQKIMPGYSGKSLGGFVLAVMAILSTTKVGTVLVVLGVPLMDASWAIFRRLLNGKSPVWGDRGHLHHKLLDLGWSKRQIIVFYWVITGLLGILALQLNSRQKFYTILGVGIIIGATLAWLSLQLIFSKLSDPDNGLKT